MPEKVAKNLAKHEYLVKKLKFSMYLIKQFKKHNSRTRQYRLLGEVCSI